MADEDEDESALVQSQKEVFRNRKTPPQQDPVQPTQKGMAQEQAALQQNAVSHHAHKTANYLCAEDGKNFAIVSEAQEYFKKVCVDKYKQPQVLCGSLADKVFEKLEQHMPWKPDDDVCDKISFLLLTASDHKDEMGTWASVAKGMLARSTQVGSLEASKAVLDKTLDGKTGGSWP